MVVSTNFYTRQPELYCYNGTENVTNCIDNSTLIVNVSQVCTKDNGLCPQNSTNNYYNVTNINNLTNGTGLLFNGSMFNISNIVCRSDGTNCLPGGNTSFNQSLTDGLYYPLSSNPANYLTDLNGFTTDDLLQGSTNLYENRSWNQSHANSLYYPLVANPAGYLTSVLSVPNATFANDTARFGGQLPSFYYAASNPSGYISGYTETDPIALPYAQSLGNYSAVSATVCHTNGTNCPADSAYNASYLVRTGDTASGNYTFDTTTFFIDSTNNRIGIGTTAPTQSLDVAGSIKSSSLTSGRIPYASTSGLLLDSNNLRFDGTTFSSGVLTVLTNNTAVFAASYTDAGSTLFGTILNAVTTTNGSNLNFVYDTNANKKIGTEITDTGRLVGQRFNVLRNFNTVGDNGTLTLLNGMTFQYGHYFSDPTVTPTTTTVTGLQLSGQAYNGTITTLNDLLITEAKTQGTITTHNGISIGALTGTTTKALISSTTAGTNKWNLYLDGTAQNYIAGNLGIGTTTPNSKLHVIGEANISGISGDGTGKVVCIKSDGNLGTCSTTVGAGGTCTCG